jgi:hypothetical protein
MDMTVFFFDGVVPDTLSCRPALIVDTMTFYAD